MDHQISRVLATFAATILINIIHTNVVQCQFNFLQDSFQINSKLTYLEGKNDPVSIGFIAESYSSLQSRAKVEYLKKATSSGKYNDLMANIYYDSMGFVIYDKLNSQCRESDLVAINGILALPDYVKPYGNGSHIFGPARLLPWVQDQATKLVANASLEDDKLIGYNLHNELTNSNKLVIEVYYSKFERRINDFVQPVLVTIKSILKNSILMVKFNGFRSSRDDIQSEFMDLKNDETEDDAADIYIDQFALPIGHCSGVLRSRQVNLIDRMIPIEELAKSGLPLEFSFKFKQTSNDEYDQLNAISVAYDQRLTTLSLTNPITNQQLSSDEHEQVLILSQVLQRDSIYYSVASSQRAHRVTFHKDDALTNQLARPDLVLLGASKFVFLGNAKVRGIRAEVYEASGTTAPLWLTRSIPVKTTESSFKLNKHTSNIFKPGELITLVYITQEHTRAYKSILAIELIRLVDLERFTFELYDFSWNLADQMDGEKGLDLLALKRSSESPELASIELNLLSTNWDKWQPNERYLARPTRNLGFHSAITRELNMIPSMGIVNFNSKFGLANGETLSKQVAISFSVLDNSETRDLNLTYLGLITIETGDPIQAYYYVRDLSDCIALSTTILAQPITYFAFDEQENQCFLIGPRSFAEQHYKPGKVGNADLFVNYQMDFSVRKKLPSENVLINRLVAIEEFSSNKKLAMFMIDKARVKMLKNDVDPYSHDEDANQPFDDDTMTNIRPEFSGFAINEEDKFNRIVKEIEIKQADGSNKTINVTSLDICKSICLADDHCQAFSFCLKPGQFKCMLSKLSFASQNVTNELNEFKKSGKSNEIIELSVPWPKSEANSDSTDQIQVKIVKQLNCELHNRLFMSYFKPSAIVKPLWSNLKVWPSNNFEGVEKCARLCLEQNLNIMRQQTDHTKILENDPMHRYTEIQKQSCSNFHYITLSWDNDTSANYCYYDSKNVKLIPSDDIAHLLPAKNTTKTMTIREFDFRFDLLYERIDGVSLLRFKLPEDLVLEYDDLLRGKKIDKNHLDTFTGLDMWGANFQTSPMCLNELDCARSCFLQGMHSIPWPSCRSFGYTIANEDRNWLVHVFNSQTLTKMLSLPKNDSHPTLIYENKTDVVRVRRYHFEPRESLKLMQSILAYDYEPEDKAQAAWTTFDTIGSIIVFFIGALIAVVLSAKLTQFIMNQRQVTARRQSRQSDGDRRNLGVQAEGDLD